MPNQEFHTQRLVLRPWVISDAPALARLTQDEGFVEFSTLSPFNDQEAGEFLASRLKLFQPGFGIWAIVADQQIVGNVQLLMQSLDNSKETLPELGYRLEKSSWGKGLATEAALTLRDYAVEQLKLNPIHAFIDVNNVRSQSVARKLGFIAAEAARFKGSDIRVWRYPGPT